MKYDRRFDLALRQDVKDWAKAAGISEQEALSDVLEQREGAQEERRTQMNIRAKIDGVVQSVEVLQKATTGFAPTHNRDGCFLKMWALAVDGRVFCTNFKSVYRLARRGETPPASFRAGGRIMSNRGSDT